MAPEQGEMHFHQLHEECHSRIRYQKVCPIHGEVPRDEIVSGYEYAKGKYVIIDGAEREQARTKSDRTVHLDKFIPPDAVDPIYFEGRNDYLVPDGAAGQKPYALLQRAMVDTKRVAIGQIALNGRDRLVLVRPIENLLAMSVLHYGAQVKQPREFDELMPDVTVKANELKLARTLIEGTSADEVDLSEYVDHYTEKLRELVEAKVAGRDVVAPPEDEDAPVVNLMDALRQSVARSRTGPRATKRTPRHGKTTRHARKRA
jgi:DNA end-binding protein Ku